MPLVNIDLEEAKDRLETAIDALNALGFCLKENKHNPGKAYTQVFPPVGENEPSHLQLQFVLTARGAVFSIDIVGMSTSQQWMIAQ